MTTWTMDPLAWTTNHYNLWHFETALIQPVLIVNIWNFEWGLIFWKYWLQKNLFSKNFENYTCGGVLKLSNWPLQYFFSLPRYVLGETSFTWIWSTIIKFVGPKVGSGLQNVIFGQISQAQMPMLTISKRLKILRIFS